MKDLHFKAAVLATAAASVMLAAAPTPASAQSAGLTLATQNCEGAEAPIAASSVAANRAALACLIDETRRQRGLSPLKYDDRLGRAARDHAADMVRRDYFAHTSPGGTTVKDRLRDSGWPTRGDWWAGEILVLGTGGASTPRRLLTAWLTSPPHRAILLSAKAARIGIGVARDTPDSDGKHAQDGVTAAAELGRLCPVDDRAAQEDPLSTYDNSRRENATCDD
ncbi:CAP domain-containing protein [Baekduia sp. Peel2402]|uniref:CAP domain-containing protein n=1 Tax=Baekduia sp. Peel2402 TaxID=3458296 RepID=UPI00403E7CC4